MGDGEQLLARQGGTVVVSVEPRDCFGNAAVLVADQAVQLELVKHGSAASRQVTHPPIWCAVRSSARRRWAQLHPELRKPAPAGLTRGRRGWGLGAQRFVHSTQALEAEEGVPVVLQRFTATMVDEGDYTLWVFLDHSVLAGWPRSLHVYDEPRLEVRGSLPRARAQTESGTLR